MQKFNKTILLALFLSTGLFSFQSLIAQEEKKESSQQVIIIEETTDEDGQKITRKIITKGTELSDDDVEKILFDVEQMSKDIKIITETNDNGEETIIIQEIEGGDDDVLIWETDAEDLRFGGDEPQPTIGVMLGEFNDDGAEVTEVIEGSGAEAAGLQKGDVINAIAGTKISSYENVKSAMAERELGEEVEIQYARDGIDHKASVALKHNDFGMKEYKLRKVKPKAKMRHKKEKVEKVKKPTLGVMIEQEDDQVKISEVLEGTPAEKAGLKSGDVIRSVNGEKIASYEALVDAIKMASKENGSLEINYIREGEIYETTAQIK